MSDTPTTPTADELFEQAMATIHAMDPANQPKPSEPDPSLTSEETEPEPESSETSPIGEGEGSEGGETETSPPSPDQLTGPRLTQEEIDRYYAFDQWLRANPEAAQAINDYAQGRSQTLQPQPPPQPIQSDLPDFIDKDDPAQAWMLQQITQLRQQQTDLITAQQERARIENEAIYTRARDAWNTKYNFSTEELAAIEQEGANLRIMGGLIAGGSTIEAATQRTLETALRSIPEIYDRYNASRTEAVRKQENADKAKQNKLGALAGRTGVTSVPAPSATPADKRAAMINDIASAMNES